MSIYGTYNPDGSYRDWPSAYVNDVPFVRDPYNAPTTVRVSADKFVVVPPNPPNEVWQRVEAVKAEFVPAPVFRSKAKEE
jgi:hypothetical protein